MRRVVVSAVLISALSFLMISSAAAQWTLLRTFPSRVRAVHFLDNQGAPSTGFVGLQSGQIWRTSDDGLTWTQCSTPNAGSITQFSFKDAMTGWCSVSASTSLPGVWITNDGGVTWAATSVRGLMVSIAYTQASGQLFASSWSGTVLRSIDGGINWQSGIAPISHNGIAFSGANGIISVLSAPGFIYTDDGGQTWTTATPRLGVECWSPLALNNGTTFFAVSESNRQVYRSTNGGASWASIYTFPQTSFPRGCITGSPNGLFVQTNSGFFASTDQGLSWYSICGPVNDVDSRFYSGGLEIFAGDNNDFGLWHIANGLLGSAAALTLGQNTYRPSGIRCRVLDSAFRFSFTGDCGATFLKAQIISGGQYFQVTSGIVPRSIAGSDSVTITYSPSSSLRDSGQLLLEFSLGARTLDTVIQLYGAGLSSSNLQLDRVLTMTMHTACVVQDSGIWIHNYSCDTVTLTTAFLSDSINFGLVGTSLPIAIAPDDSATLLIRATGTHEGTFGSTLHLHFSEGTTISIDTTVPLLLNILQSTKPHLQSLNLSLDNRCTNLDTSFTIQNPECDSIVLLSAFLTDNTVFQLKTLQLPLSIVSNGSISIPIHIAPAAKGKYASFLRLSYQSGTQRTDTAVRLQITIKNDLPVSAMLSTSRLNMGRVSAPCDRSERNVTIANTLCRDLKVVAVKWLNTDKQFAVRSRSLPFSIAPGSTDSLTITFIPDHAANTTVQLRVTLELDGIQHDTVIVISGSGVSVYNDTLLHSELRYDSLMMCETKVLETSIINLSCPDVNALAAQLAGSNGYEVLSPSFPVILHTHDTLKVRVRLTPRYTGRVDDSITITLRNTLDGVDYPRTVPLHAVVRPTVRRAEITETAVTAIGLQPCFTMDTAVTLYNRGTCEDIVLRTAEITGSIGISLDPRLTLPLSIAPGDSLRIPFRIYPKEDNVAVSRVRLVGENIDTALTITFSALVGAHVLQANLTDSNFVTKPCVRVAQTCTFKNDGCDSLLVDEVSLKGIDGQDQFGFVTPLSLPLKLLSGDSVNILVRYDPDGNGDDHANLHFMSHDGRVDRTIPLSGSILGSVPAARLGVTSSDNSINIAGPAGSDVTAVLRLMDNVGHSVGLQTISLDIHHDANLLTPSHLFPGPGWRVIDSNVASSGILHLKLHSGGSPKVAGDPVLTTEFRVAVAREPSSDIAVKNVRFNDDDPNYERCTLASLMDLEPLHFTMTDVCGSSIERSLINNSPAFRIVSVTPNPAKAGNGGMVNLNLNVMRGGEIGVVIRDVLGHQILRLDSTLKAGRNNLPVDLSTFAEGSYFISVIAQGSVTTQKLMIESR